MRARHSGDRMVIISAQTILELFKDYLGEDNLPRNAELLSVQYRSNDKGRLALLVESPDFSPGDPQEHLVSVDLREGFALGGTG